MDKHQIEPLKGDSNPAFAKEPAHGSRKRNTGEHPLLALQQQAGNHAVQELLRGSGIQAKLTVSHPGDPEEQEADQVADHLMRTRAGYPSSASCTCAEGESCENCRQTGAMIQRRANGASNSPASSVPNGSSNVKDVAKGGIVADPTLHGESGRPLDTETLAFFESRLGHDLSDVRVHTGNRAAESARSIDALAYTSGRSVVFGDGQYAPETPRGKHLLAHELAHVIRQGEAPERHAPPKPKTAVEFDADDVKVTTGKRNNIP